MSYGDPYNTTVYNAPQPGSTLTPSGRYGYGPSRYIYRNQVDLYARIAAKDREKATIGALYELVASSVPCSVQPGDIMTRYTPDEKIEQFIPYEIYFRTNPAQGQYNMVNWIDDSGASHDIAVIGTRSLAGRGNVWAITGEERI